MMSETFCIIKLLKYNFHYIVFTAQSYELYAPKLYALKFKSCLRPQHTTQLTWNKANLRDLIAATGLVILLKFDPIHR